MFASKHLHIRPSLRIFTLAFAHVLAVSWLLGAGSAQADQGAVPAAPPIPDTIDASDRVGDDGGYGSHGDDGDGRGFDERERDDQ